MVHARLMHIFKETATSNESWVVSWEQQRSQNKALLASFSDLPNRPVIYVENSKFAVQREKIQICFLRLWYWMLRQVWAFSGLQIWIFIVESQSITGNICFNSLTRYQFSFCHIVTQCCSDMEKERKKQTHSAQSKLISIHEAVLFNLHPQIGSGQQLWSGVVSHFLK